MGGVVLECFWVADVILVVVGSVTFYMDSKHVLNVFSQSIEGGSGKWFMVVKIVIDPQRLNSTKADFSRA